MNEFAIYASVAVLSFTSAIIVPFFIVPMVLSKWQDLPTPVKATLRVLKPSLMQVLIIMWLTVKSIINGIVLSTRSDFDDKQWNVAVEWVEYYIERIKNLD